MKIYCIGDLHLSGDPPRKPMEIFGENWRNHALQIKANWERTVGQQDVVIVCGDISWGMTLGEAAQDLEWLLQLPGRKLLLRGNHDYWWTSVSKMRQQYPGLEFIQNDYVLLGKTGICGSRGWKVPSNEDFTPEDEKIYRRELLRLDMGLAKAMAAGAEEIIVALHYPPVFQENEENGYTELFRKYPVVQVVFGHIHGENNISVFEGVKDGVTYHLCSSDIRHFMPVQVKDMEGTFL